MQTPGPRIPRSVLVTALLAAVVVVGAMIVVVALRPHAPAPAVTTLGPGAPLSSTGSGVVCGTVPCLAVATQNVGGTKVTLLAAPDGRTGFVRIGPDAAEAVVELTITQLGARLGQDSLQCATGATLACLVRAPGDGGDIGEVLANGGDNWQALGKPYLSDAGYIGLQDVSGDGSPDVILVRHECPASQPGTVACNVAPVLAEVFELGGESLGCTRKYTSPSQLRGWPQVRLTPADLRKCP